MCFAALSSIVSGLVFSLIKILTQLTVFDFSNNFTQSSVCNFVVGLNLLSALLSALSVNLFDVTTLQLVFLDAPGIQHCSL